MEKSYQGGVGLNPLEDNSLPLAAYQAAQSPMQLFGIQVFFTGDEPLHDTMNARDYVFKHGINTVGSQLEHQRDQKDKPMYGMPLVIATNGDASMVVTELLRRNEDKGLVIVTGDPKFDAQLRIDARKRWVKWMMAQTSTVVSKHLDACDAALSLGRPAPAPTMQFRKAKAFQDFHDKDMLDRKRYIVQADGSDFDTLTAAQAYVASQFPAYVGNPKVIFDALPHEPAVIGDTEIEAPLAGVKLTVREKAPVAPAVEEEIPAVDPQLMELAILKQEANALLMRSAVEGIMFPGEIREGLVNEAEPGMLRIVIDEAKSFIDTPADQG